MNRKMLDLTTVCIGVIAQTRNMSRQSAFMQTKGRDLTDIPEAKQIILDIKIASVIAKYAERYNVSLEEATETFYNSVTAQLIEERIADMHCRSDIYLADELHLEVEEKKQ